MDETSLIHRICTLLSKEFDALAEVPLSADTSLLHSGLLDSFAVVSLVMALEVEFGIAIDVESLELEQFETPASIAGVCRAVING